MHYHVVADFKNQELAIHRFGTIDAKIVKTTAAMNFTQGDRMALSKTAKSLHESGLLTALDGILVHPRVKVVNHPVTRYSDMCDIGTAFDQNDPHLPEKTIGTAVVDKISDIKIIPFYRIKVASQCVG